MNWPWHERDILPPEGRGRPGQRLARGLLWAIVAIFVISILVFWLGRCMWMYGESPIPVISPAADMLMRSAQY